MKKLSKIILLCFFISRVAAQPAPSLMKNSTQAISYFSDGWTAAIKKDYVQATKDSLIVYLFYPVNIVTDIKPDIFLIRRHFWTSYIKNIFTNEAVEDLLCHTERGFIFSEGPVTERQTGKLFYIFTDTSLLNSGKREESAAFVVCVYPYNKAKSFQQRLKFKPGSLYRKYNRFVVPPDSLTGKWEEKLQINDESLYPYPYTIMSYTFNKDSTYTSLHQGAAGGNLIGFWHYEGYGTYSTAGNVLTTTPTNNQLPVPGKFEYRFEAVGESKKVLHLKNKRGEQYRLLNSTTDIE